MIDFYATEPHYVEHLAPVWHALPEPHRGTFWCSHTAHARTHQLGIQAQAGFDRSHRLVLVAAHRDQQRIRQPVALLEHGAGQSYGDLSPHYTGGADREHYALILVPNQRTAAAAANAVVVGAPKLDHLALAPTATNNLRSRVALSFHWDCQLYPETRSSWDEIRPELAAAAQGPWDLVLHSHPRIRHRVATTAQLLGIPYEPDFDRILATCDLYAIDNSSTLFEFLLTGRPVVVINSSHYRRTVNHGLRFWEYADVGVNCDEPAHLFDTIDQALQDTDALAARRSEVARMVYPLHDGHSAQRCAQALLDWSSGANLRH